MSKLAVALVAFATLTTGCAAIGTKRPSGGQPLQKTASDDRVQVETPALDQRADLGQR